ncbi:hypothetical protein PHLGIDRAFT_327433 [Phlebiopsis gigantea 11061_1 CR5-6]|uniref:Dihydrodipicolinate synthase n=1 Tax=Phlebiopsis gigantea (strain 11061_1 CR5-6) TaxID=745531 RepID=A0A0C3S758_PHLG1|nr:hypothetical protein PHLGIDRAFT_327433 [Phlebiopsis gigantea 11061_1 CR5-6]
MSRILKSGVFCPILTFFQADTEDLDLDSFKKHVLHVTQAGIGPVIVGSNGEAIHLSHEERTTLIQTARQTLDSAGFTDVPIIAGTGGGSTRETLLLTTQAAQAGADYALVITSGYYAGSLASNKPALKAYYKRVAADSPIPILLYNYPGASGGIDLDSDLITELAIECPNIVGVKLTCGNVGKLTRICATVSGTAFAASYPRKNPADQFLVLGGYSDFLVPSTYAGGHGCITGLANLAPYSIASLYANAIASLEDRAQLLGAQHAQGIVARADFTIANAGVSGTKAILEKLEGYGGLPRSPLPPASAEATEALWKHSDVQELVALEKQLRATPP